MTATDPDQARADLARAAGRLAREVLAYVERCDDRSPAPPVAKIVAKRAEEATATLGKLEKAQLTPESIEILREAAEAIAAAQPVSFAKSRKIR